MHFGKRLAASAVPQWSRFYLNFRRLKRLVTRAETARVAAEAAGEAPLDGHSVAAQAALAAAAAAFVAAGQAAHERHQDDPAAHDRHPMTADAAGDSSAATTTTGAVTSLNDIVTQFFFTLDRELEMVNYFYDLKIAKFTMATSVLCIKADVAVTALANQQPAPNVELIETALRDLHTSLNKLREFISLNRTGFEKILKKFDRRVHRAASDSYLKTKVYPAKFLSDTSLALLRTKVSESLRAVVQARSRFVDGLSSLPTNVADAVRIMHTAVSLDRAHKLATLISATFPSLSGTSAVADALRELSVDELTPSNSSMSAGSSFSSASPDVVGHAGTHTLASTIERLRHAALEPGTSVGKVSANVPAAAAAPAPSAPTNAAVVTPPTMLGPEVMFVLAPVFIAACKRGAVKCVHVLLSFGVNVNTQSDADDQSGLFAATAGGHRACMSLLLSRGANPNLVDHESRMALHAAVLRGDKEAVALLLAAGADVAARDHDGHSMLFFAVSTGNADIVQQLIDAGAPTNTSAVPASPLSGRLYDQPPLLLSCRFGFFDVANRLICAGADPNATDEAGETALHAACSENAVECVELLLKHQAQVDVRDVYSSRTPLFDAAIGGHLSCVEKLLAAGAKALVRDVDGWRPLVHAMLRGHMFVVAVLREHERAEQKANPTELRAPKPANPSFVAPRRAGQLHPHIQASDKAPAPSAVPKPPSPSIVDGEVTEKISNAERSYGHTYLRRRTRIDIFLGGVDDQGPIIDLLHYGHTMRDSNGAFTSRRTLYDPILTSTFQERPPGEIATSQTAVLVKSESSTDFSHDTALGPIERSASFSTLGAPQASPMFDKQNVPLSLSSFRLQIASNQPQTDLVMIDLPIVEPSAAHHMYYCEDIATMQLRIDVISQADDTLIGRGFILASTLARLRGETRCALFSPSMQLIGTVLITFLIVKPLHHPRVAVGSNTYWKLTESLPIIGHRGVGAGGAAKTGDFHRTHIKENTVLSFVTAASLGAQYVEFDVQMTKDGVPVIYHDWTVKETGYNLPVCRLSLEKFTSIYHAQGGRSKDRRLVRSKSFDAADIVSARPLQAGSGVTHDVAHDIMNSPKSSARPVRHKRDNDYQAMLESAIKLQIGDEGVAAPFPTLEDALKNVPITLGFNVEVKYPLREEREEFDLQMMELNNFIDRILTCVYDNAGERPIIFSSFHPETCLMLSLKQPNYPVFFLTSAGWDNERFSDPRCNSIYWAIHFAKAANLLGIVSQSAPFLECPELVHAVKSSGLLLLTWGRGNNDVTNVQLQRDYGVDAVILDHVAHVRSGLQAATAVHAATAVPE